MTGSRKWADKAFVRLTLSYTYCLIKDPYMTLVHGECHDSPDMYADEWAYQMKRLGFPIEVEPHPADWRGKHKKAAGFVRDAEMVKLGANLCLAFIQDDSRGASYTADLAEKAGIETVRYRNYSEGYARGIFTPEENSRRSS